MDNKIVPLEGPDRVRRRPAVIFGSSDSEGVMSAFEMMLDILAEESAAGYSEQMAIVQYADGSVEVQDCSRGIYLGDDGRICQELFTRLFTEKKHRPIYDAPSQEAMPWEGYELCAVQYASEYMDVCVHRDGEACKLHFEKGVLKSMTSAPSDGYDDTSVRFKPDADVFSETDMSAQWLFEKAKTLALMIPGMQVIFRNESAGGVNETAFCYPDGIADYLKYELKNATSAVYTAQLEAEGQERYNRPHYTAKLKVGLCFSEGDGAWECYHNRRALPNGGTHVEQLIRKIKKYLSWILDSAVTEKAVLSHLQMVVISEADHTCWVNGARTAIENILIRDMAEDLIGEDFRWFAKENRELLEVLFG